MAKLTHIDDDGKAKMVDVSAKSKTHRTATAAGSVLVAPKTLQLIIKGHLKKGDVISTARIAGIMAAKRTSEIIPLCHPLILNVVDLELLCNEKNNSVDISATCKVDGKTGVEMEALTAVTAAALTIYDMCKAVDRSIQLTAIRLVHKAGGDSGEFMSEK